MGTIALYPAEFSGFLKNGGYLAWGIVPTTEVIRDENTGSIKNALITALSSYPTHCHRNLLLVTDIIDAVMRHRIEKYRRDNKDI